MKTNATRDMGEKVEHSLYLLQVLLPFIRQLDEEQMIENETEAKIQGIMLLFKDIKLILKQS